MFGHTRKWNHLSNVPKHVWVTTHRGDIIRWHDGYNMYLTKRWSRVKNMHAIYCDYHFHGPFIEYTPTEQDQSEIWVYEWPSGCVMTLEQYNNRKSWKI